MNTLQVYDPFADAGIDQLFRGFFRPVRETRDTAAAIKVDVDREGRRLRRPRRDSRASRKTTSR